MSCGSLVNCLFIAGINKNAELKNTNTSSYRLVKNVQILSSELNASRQNFKRKYEKNPKYSSLFKNEKVIKFGKVLAQVTPFPMDTNRKPTLPMPQDLIGLPDTMGRSASPTRGITEKDTLYLRIQFYDEETDNMDSTA
jgi:hypothetical protein